MVRNFENWTTISGIFSQIFCCMRKNGQNSTSGQILRPNLKPHGLFPIRLRILVALYSKVYACIDKKRLL